MAISKRAVAVVLLVAVAGAAHAFDNPLSADGEWSNIKASYVKQHAKRRTD